MFSNYDADFLKTLGGRNASVAGWGSVHDAMCTTNQDSPSPNERCDFPFEEKLVGASDDSTVSYKSCTYAANPSTKIPACKDFYKLVHTLKPFPKFPILLETENRTVVCHNNTHGRFGWCRTFAHEKGEEIKDTYNKSVEHLGEKMKSFSGENWGWCRKHCHQTNVMRRSKNKKGTDKQ